jgi:hypothetical protein
LAWRLRRQMGLPLINIQRERTCGLYKLTSRECGLLPEFALHHEFSTAQNPLRNFGLRWVVTA